MLFTLIKVRLRALFAMMFGRRPGTKPVSKPKKIAIAVFAVYIGVMLMFSLGSMMYAMAEPLASAGLGWLYFSIAAIFAAIMSIMASIFTIQKELFDAKDNELLLSMPIPYSYILASRLIIIIVLELIYTAMLMIPAGIAYAIFGGGLTVQGTIALIVQTLLLLLLVLSIGALLSWIASIVISRMKNKTLFTTIFMFAFFGVYFWFYSNLGNYINKLISQGESIAETVRKAVPPAYSFGMAITSEGISGLAHLGIFALWSIIPFAITYFILTRTFLKLATSNKPTVTIEYKKRELKVSSGFSALVRKEIRRFFTLPIYLLNCGLGAVFMIFLPIFAVIKLDTIMEVFATIPEGSKLMAPVFCMALGFCAIMCDIAAPSLSLEGNVLWLLKSSPISPQDIYRAKIACNIIVCMPCVVFAGTVLAIVLPVSALEKALLLILPAVILVFTAVFGMAMNILFPRFDWVNETIVVKQSGSVLAAVLGGMAIAALPILLFIPASSIMPADLFLILCTAAFAGATAAIYSWIMTRGVKRFADM